MVFAHEEQAALTRQQRLVDLFDDILVAPLAGVAEIVLHLLPGGLALQADGEAAAPVKKLAEDGGVLQLLDAGAGPGTRLDAAAAAGAHTSNNL